MKKKAIMIWFEKENRPELIKPFLDMSEEVEFIHLCYRSKRERSVETSPFEMIYWFDFKTPYQLLNKYKPDFIVGTTETLLSISLIAASKELNIPFYGLQHGFSPEDIDAILPQIKRRSIVSSSVLGTYLKTTVFFFSSLKFKRSGRLVQYFRVFFYFYTSQHVEAVRKNRYSWLKPDHYICFSEYSSSIYRKMYDLTTEEIKFVGIPSLDNFFKGCMDLVQRDTFEKYYVLIDTNFEEYFKPIGPDQISRCYQVLAKYCKGKGAKLYIKLHPWSYKYEYEDSEVVVFLKNVDMEELGGIVSKAEGCFGFYSTLTMPIVFIKPTIQIKYDDVFDRLLVDKNVTPVIDFYSFEQNDIKFNSLNGTIEELKEEFLFKTDGKAIERLKQILLS